MDVTKDLATRDPEKLAVANATLDAYDKIARDTDNVIAGTANTLEDARIASANQFAPLANYAMREAGWVISQLDDGSFGWSFPIVTDAGVLNGGTVSVKYVENRTFISSVKEGWHNHFDSNSQFSGADALWVSRGGRSKPSLGLIDLNGNTSLLKRRIVDGYKKRNGQYRVPQLVPKRKSTSLDLKIDLSY